MTPEDITTEIYEAMVAGAVLGVPILGAGLLIALVLGIFQAATQIQDQSIPQIVKILLVSLLLAAMGIGLSQPLYQHADRLFTDFPELTRGPS